MPSRSTIRLSSGSLMETRIKLCSGRLLRSSLTVGAFARPEVPTRLFAVPRFR
jgi:hypothetical protein